jgi:hypothetical protein
MSVFFNLCAYTYLLSLHIHLLKMQLITVDHQYVNVTAYKHTFSYFLKGHGKQIPLNDFKYSRSSPSQANHVTAWHDGFYGHHFI